jgi:hypothetical protein
VTIPYRQIRAFCTVETIRVYQAYSDAIADSALQHGTFVSPLFKMDRMTWIKPSFLWMMYRSGWGKKDTGQNRILAIDIAIQGFEWALANSCLSHYSKGYYASEDEWLKTKARSPVRVQWDPERNLHLQPLQYRSIQIGLSGEAVKWYVKDWIRGIQDVTEMAHQIHKLVEEDRCDEAMLLLPAEKPYEVDNDLAYKIGMEL